MRQRAAVAAGVLLAHPRHAVLAALVAGLLLGGVPPAWAVAGALAAGLVPWLASRIYPPTPGLVLARGGLGLATALAVLGGAAFAEARLAATGGARLQAASGHTVSVRAAVLEPIRQRAGGPAVARVRISGGALDGEVAVMRMRGGHHAGPWPAVGEIVALEGRVAPLGPFDAYQRPRGAGGAIDATSLRATGERRGGVAGGLDAVRRRAEAGLEHGLRAKEADLLRGMVLGEDERLDDEVRDDFQRSGLAHLLAVSGQNVVLLCVLVLGACALLGVPLRLRFVLALALVAAYVPLAGGGPSIQRAGVMGAAGLIAALAGRPASRWYAVGLAAVATLALNPRSAADPGWQLSFAAVVSLLILCAPLRAIFERSMPRPVAEAAGMTVAATVGTAPLLALHFEQVSLASLPANLLAAPAVAPIMWLGMLSAAVAQVSPSLAAPLNELDGPLLAYLSALAHAAATLPYAAVPLRIGPHAAVALAAAIPVAAGAAARALAARLPPPGIAPQLSPARRAPLLGLGCVALACCALVAVRHAHPDFRAAPGEMVVSFLDVGQGDATLIQDGTGASMLFDGGPPEARVYRELRAAGVRRLDLMVATHQSRDHQGGLHGVLARFPTRLLLENGDGTRDPDFRRLIAEADARGVRRIAAHAGQELRIGRMVVRVFSPRPRTAGVPPPADPNPRGVAAIVSFGTFDLWLSADAESEAILPLHLRRVEAMKVSHHGSSDPGLPEVLRRLRPAVAAIEVGAHNTYGHPAPSTLSALRAAVPHVYRTDRDGTVVLHVSGSNMRVTHG
jgi:competence protein ComEC